MTSLPTRIAELAVDHAETGHLDTPKERALRLDLEQADTEVQVLKTLLAQTRPQWFYHPDYPEYCKFDPSEVIDEDYDFEPGFHVAEIHCAMPLPSIWCAVHVRTDDELDALGTDDRVVCTEHATEAEARAALEAKP